MKISLVAPLALSTLIAFFVKAEGDGGQVQRIHEAGLDNTLEAEHGDDVSQHEGGSASASYGAKKCFSCPRRYYGSDSNPCKNAVPGAVFPACHDKPGGYVQCGLQGQCAEKTCPPDAYWDQKSRTCFCSGGQVWHEVENICVCPEKACFDINENICLGVDHLTCQVCPKLYGDFNPCYSFLGGQKYPFCGEDRYFVLCLPFQQCLVRECPRGQSFNPISGKCRPTVAANAQEPLKEPRKRKVLCPVDPDDPVDSDDPSPTPSLSPSATPSLSPSGSPSAGPSISSSPSASDFPSVSPSLSNAPSASSLPSESPSKRPSAMPIALPPDECSNSITCPDGEFIVIDPDGACSCAPCPCDGTPNACPSCPDGTICVKDPNDNPFCRDCSCGGCRVNTDPEEPCCEINAAGNNCKSAGDVAKVCAVNQYYFPGLSESGNLCSGVEVSDTAQDNGCGCQPSTTTPCFYDPNAVTEDERCFICNVEDLVDAAQSMVPDMEVCNGCITCIDTNCQMVDDLSVGMGPSEKTFDGSMMMAFRDCIKSETDFTDYDRARECIKNVANPQNMDPECRESQCLDACFDPNPNP